MSDLRLRAALRRYQNTGAFGDLVNYYMALARAGEIDPEIAALIANADWCSLYQISQTGESLTFPVFFELLTFIYSLPRNTVLCPPPMTRTIGDARSNLLYIIAALPGSQTFLARIIEPVHRKHPRYIEVIHAIHASSRIPTLPRPVLLSTLENMVRLGLPELANAAAAQLKIIGNPLTSIPALKERVLDHQLGAGWTPISLMESIAVIGRDEAIDVLMEIMTRNPISGVIGYGSRALAHAIAEHNTNRIEEGIEHITLHLDRLRRPHRQYSIHDIDDARGAAHLLRLIRAGAHYSGPWHWDRFQRSRELRREFWQERRLRERLGRP